MPPRTCRRLGARRRSRSAAADEALERGLELAEAEGGPLVVAGSLYLVGHVRGRLTGGQVP